MKLRRVLGTLIATAFFGTMIQPIPALAAAPVLDIITVDPAHSSQAKTGLAHLDATSFVPPATNPGTDSSQTDHIIRTNDVINYDFNFNVNAADATAVVVTSTLGLSGGVPVADWVQPLPSACGPGSNVTPDGQTLTCNIGAVTQGSVRDVVPSAKIRVTAPNGATIEPSVIVSDVADGATQVQADGYFDGQGTPSVEGISDTITGIAKYNALKKGTSAQPVTEPFTYFGDGGVQGYYVDFPILVREGDGQPSTTGSAGVGITTAPSTITITDTINGLNATLAASNPCGVNGTGITMPQQPYGKIGIGGSTVNNAVIDSGTITCSQAGGAGTPVTITITNPVSTGATYPINHATGSGIDNRTYIVSGYLRMWVPDTGGNLAGGGTPFTDTYTGINPGTDTADEPPANLTATVTLNGQGPAPGHGTSGKIFRMDTAETNFPSSNANGPALTAGQHIVSIFAVTNNATVAQGSADLTNVIACDTIDTTKILVTPFTGDSVGAVDALYGGAVHLSTLSGGTLADGALGVTVLYGDSTTASDCSTTTNFKTSATDPSFTALNPILRVRVTAPGLAHPVFPATSGESLRVDLSETIIGTLTAGTLVHNNMTATATSSTGGSAYTQSVSTQGQIFTTNIGVTKYLFKDTAGHGVFNANGTQPPGAAGSSSGTQGAVDTNQQFVAALDDDGSQGTLPSNSVLTCDILPPNVAIKDFDGTTGPAIATYGGPVAFATVSGTTPASFLVEYSTVPTFGGDTCTDGGGGWTTAPPLPRSTITRVRATYNLPALTRVRMLVNFQVNPVVTVGTVMTNNTVTTVGGVNPQTAAQSVLIEPETVRAQKTPASQSIVAGQNATFTVSGTVQGAGNPSSGVVTIVDTLPVGFIYVPGSATLTAPPNPTTWVAASGSATPTLGMAGANHTLTWTLGTVTASPGVFIQLPTVTYSATSDLSSSGTVVNSVTIADTTDGSPGAAGHTATANVVISNTSAFQILKTTNTPTIPVGGVINWSLVYANTAGTNANSTDFIDELPYNGDSRGSSFHGTLALTTVAGLAPGATGQMSTDAAAGSFPITVTYTKAAHGQINDDPSCTSNGGAITSGCTSVATTVWCPTLSGGTCPATAAEVTGVRMTGGAFNANTPARTITMTATTSGNVFTDIYWNLFGGRTDFLTLPVHSPKVQTVVPIPPIPFLTLAKSCTAPANCTTVSQPPGQDLTYAILATNTGGHATAQVTITDVMPHSQNPPFTFYTDFKLGTATTSGFPGGVTMVVSYSSDGGTTFTYTPVSGGGGAAAGYDRSVTAIRWTMTAGQLDAAGGNSTGTVLFTAAIQ